MAFPVCGVKLIASPDWGIQCMLSPDLGPQTASYQPWAPYKGKEANSEPHLLVNIIAVTDNQVNLTREFRP